MKEIICWDFDGTITCENTMSRRVEWLAPKDNLRKNVKSHFIHNDETISAIATFHSSLRIISHYVAALLNVPQSSMTTSVVVQDSNYRITALNIPQFKHPLFIATPNLDNESQYFKSLNFLEKNGMKNILIQRLAENLPQAEKYTLYEDSPENISEAAKLKFVNCYYVKDKPNEFNPELKVKATCSYAEVIDPKKPTGMPFFNQGLSNEKCTNEDKPVEVSSNSLG